MILILTGVRGDLIAVLFSIFLMINDVEHIFMNPLAICISSLEKYSHPLYILKFDGFAVVFFFGLFSFICWVYCYLFAVELCGVLKGIYFYKTYLKSVWPFI